MPFRRNPVIPADSGAIPADSGAIPAELPDSGRNLWGTVKYWKFAEDIAVAPLIGLGGGAIVAPLLMRIFSVLHKINK